MTSPHRRRDMQDYFHHAGLTALEFRVFQAVAECPLPGPEAGQLARAFNLFYKPPPQIDVPDYLAKAEQAIRDLINRGLLQVMTQETLDELAALIVEEDTILFDLLPEPGQVDFTWSGAILWLGLRGVGVGHRSEYAGECRYDPINGVNQADILTTDEPAMQRTLVRNLLEMSSHCELLGVAGSVGFDAKSNVSNVLWQASETCAAKSGAVRLSAADAAYLAARWPNAPPQAIAAALRCLCEDLKISET